MAGAALWQRDVRRQGGKTHIEGGLRHKFHQDIALESPPPSRSCPLSQQITLKSGRHRPVAVELLAGSAACKTTRWAQIERTQRSNAAVGTNARGPLEERRPTAARPTRRSSPATTTTADGQAARLPPSYLDCCDKPSENGHAHPPPIHMNSTADRGHPKKSVPGRACIIPHHALHLPPLASPNETARRRSRPPITSTAVQPPYLLAAAALALVLLPARAVAVENELHLEGRGGWESLGQGRDRERASKWARGERSV